MILMILETWIGFIFSLISHCSSEPISAHPYDYCVVGAGPGGLQMGYFLKKQNRSYVIFERSSIPGSFFLKYPRHRKLISINKRHTGRVNREFNLRHDWNSLLSADDDLLFGKYSQDYFPQADDYLAYLGDYSDRLALHIQYNTEITKVIPENEIEEGVDQDCKFLLTDQSGSRYCCSYPIIATGLPVPGRLEPKKGEELIEYYETVPIDGESFEGQNVLVIGRGNSGMELIAGIYGRANFVHSLARSRVRLSWETHYVGDVRGINNELLDSYMLKSLDGLMESEDSDMYFRRHTDGKIYINTHEQDNPEDVANLANSPIREGYDRVVGCLGFQWDASIVNLTGKFQLPQYKIRGPNSVKYPFIDDKYESLQIEGLFFAGTITHSLDWQKSAGGFIHGYRYTVRGLHRLLEWRNHRVPWPHRHGSIVDLTSTVLKRSNEASGLYQMFTAYCDVIIVHRSASTFTYLEEFPFRLLPRLVSLTGHAFKPAEDFLFTLSLEYGEHFSEPGKDNFGRGRATINPGKAHKCNFLHPVIRFFKKIPADGEFEKFPWSYLYKQELAGWHHIVEDFTTSFDSLEIHVAPLRRFFEFSLGMDLKPLPGESCVIGALLKNHGDGDLQIPRGCAQFMMK